MAETTLSSQGVPLHGQQGPWPCVKMIALQKMFTPIYLIKVDVDIYIYDIIIEFDQWLWLRCYIYLCVCVCVWKLTNSVPFSLPSTIHESEKKWK